MLRKPEILKMGVLLVATILFLASSPCQLNGQNWSRILRKSMDVADNVPIRQADEFAAEIGSSKSLRDGLSRQIDNWDSLDSLNRARRINSKLDALLKLDPSLAKSVSSLDDAAKPTALILLEGSQKAKKLVPDLARRAELVERGGIQTITAIGLHGDDAARQVLKLDSLIKSGKLITPSGSRALNLSDLGSFLSKGGDPAWNFWKSKVIPNWDKWLAGGALTAFLVNPDYFIDSAGEITREGMHRLTELAGKILAEAIRGAGDGSKEAGESISIAVRDTYFSGWNGIYALLGTVLVLGVLIPRSRQWFLRKMSKHLSAQNEVEK